MWEDLKKSLTQKKMQETIRWKPDLEVFTDIAVPEYFLDVHQTPGYCQCGVTFYFATRRGKRFETTEFCYQNGISLKEIAGEDTLYRMCSFGKRNASVRDREDKPEYKTENQCSLLRFPTERNL